MKATAKSGTRSAENSRRRELSRLGQGNSGESNSTWFHDRLTVGYKKSFRTKDDGQGTLEEAFSRSVKIGKVLAWVNSWLKRLFLTRNCLKLVYTRTGGTSEIDSPPLRPVRTTRLQMRLIFLPGCVYSQRAGQRLVCYHGKNVLCWHVF